VPPLYHIISVPGTIRVIIPATLKISADLLSLNTGKKLMLSFGPDKKNNPGSVNGIIFPEFHSQTIIFKPK
jgi:hypothetical protein